MTPHQEGIRAAVLGGLINLVLAAGKVVTGVVGNSYALVADGIESTMDVVSSLVVIGGIHFSAQPADEEHPYGHGKAEPLAGVLVATFLLFAAGWIAWHSIEEIRSPHHAPAFYTLPVLAGVVLIKELLSRRVLNVGRRLESTAVMGDAWHHRSDALTSAAAFIGISIALLGGPGYESADDWAALLACLVIGGNGTRLIRASINELMDASVSPQVVARVRRIAGGVDGVRAIEKCRIRKTGLDLTMDIHVIVDAEITVREGHAIAHAVKDELLNSGNKIVDVTVHIEPTDARHGPQRP